MDVFGVRKISSVADGNVIDIDDAKYQHGTLIKAWNDNGTRAQTWKIEKEALGYKFMAAGAKEVGCKALVMDEFLSSGAVQLCKTLCGNNQHWRIEPVPGKCDTYYIISARTGNYLINMGKGCQLTTTDQCGINGDTTWWRFQTP